MILVSEDTVVTLIEDLNCMNISINSLQNKSRSIRARLNLLLEKYPDVKNPNGRTLVEETVRAYNERIYLYQGILDDERNLIVDHINELKRRLDRFKKIQQDGSAEE